MAVNNSQLDIDKNTWNNLDYSQQQSLLKSNSKLQGALNSLGLTVKSAPNTNPNIQKTQGGNYPANNTTISGYTNSSSSNNASNNADVGTGAVAGMNNTPIINAGGVQSQQYMTYDPKYYRTEAPKQYSTQNPKYATNNTNAQYSTQNPKYSNNQNQYKTENPKYATNNTNVNTNTPKMNTGNGTNGYISPKQQEWDYQDNSQARMNQIADNLDKYSVTNPDLFNNYDSFYNFFIAGKGRSEDQIKFLDNYYKTYKRNEKYGNMTPGQVGDGIANGTIPEDYINDVAAKDPNKAEAIKTALNDAQDGIANEGYLNSLASSSGLTENVYPQQIEWGNEQGLFIDEDHNWIDDRREHYATQEERDLTDSVLAATKELMKNHNTERDQIDNIIDEYPDIDYGTAVLLANDRNQKLYKRDDELNISIAQMNGTLKYLQDERAEKNKAGADTISQLQKNYQMFYQYSPQGIAELAQAQYEANNITLERAENGNDIDKERAVDQVIGEYFDKYGSIIERPKSQVVQDALAYAKKNGVSLSDAINETFTKYLKQKPGYATLAAGGSTNGSWTLEPIKDADGNIISYVKIDKNTGTVEGLSGLIGGLGASGTGEGGTSGTNNGGYTDYTPISEAGLKQGLKSFAENHVIGSTGGQCGSFVNDYLKSLGYDRLYTDPVNKKKAITNSNTPKVGAVAVMDSKNYPQYGHVAIVASVDNENGTVSLYESNWGDDKKVHWRKNVPISSIYGYFDPSITPNQNYGYGENPMSSYLTNLGKKDLNADQKKDLKFVNQSYNLLYRIASSGDLDHLIKSGDMEKLIQNMNSKSFQSTEGEKTFSAVKSMLTKNISDQTNLKTIGDIAELITLKLRKESGAAISAGEWTSGFESFLPGAGENYDTALAKYVRFEQDYLIPSIVYAGGKLEDYKSLFSPNSPYYKRVSSTKNKDTTSTKTNTKGTWNIGTTTNVGGTNYNSLFSDLGL